MTGDIFFKGAMVIHFRDWLLERYPSPSNCHGSQGPRYVRAKSKMRLTVSDADAWSKTWHKGRHVFVMFSHTHTESLNHIAQRAVPFYVTR